MKRRQFLKSAVLIGVGTLILPRTQLFGANAPSNKLNIALIGTWGRGEAHFGANDPYQALKTTLKAEIDAEAWATLHSDTSRPFEKPKNGRIAVKVINHLGDEVMKVFRV